MFGTSWNCIFTVVLPYIYNPDSGNMQGKTCFVFAGCSGLACIAAWIYLPEMKGRTAMEIDEMFAQRLSTKAFEKWQSRTDSVGNTLSSNSDVSSEQKT